MALKTQDCPICGDEVFFNTDNDIVSCSGCGLVIGIDNDGDLFEIDEDDEDDFYEDEED